MDIDQLRETLKVDEGVKNEIYLDHLGLPTCGIGHLITEDEPDNLIFMISVASLAVPYFGLKNSYKNQIAKGSIEEFQLYEEIYSRESIKNIIKGCVVLGLLAGVGYLGFVSTLNFGSFGSSSSGHCCF